MLTCEARKAWPDKFLWQNINLNWYELPPEKFKENLHRVINAAEHKRHCLMTSEEAPQNWKESVPLVLDILDS